MRFGSYRIKSLLVCISLYTTTRHSSCGMDGYRLSTLMVTRMASSGILRCCRAYRREVELWG